MNSLQDRAPLHERTRHLVDQYADQTASESQFEYNLESLIADVRQETRALLMAQIERKIEAASRQGELKALRDVLDGLR